MAIELALTTTVWLQEGLRLKDAILRLVGAPLVKSYIDAREAYRNLPWQGPGNRALTPEERRRRSSQRDELHQACVAPLIEALNSGRIIAVRPSAGISEFVRLLPPATGWQFRVFDLDKSLIFEPNSSYGSLFVLFMFADREQSVKLDPVAVDGLSATTNQQRQSFRPSGKVARVGGA